MTGTSSVFVRASGCNLRCWFCDTPYASWNPEGEDLSVDEILRQVDALLAVEGSAATPSTTPDVRCRHAVLTGGEPMLFAELVPLAAALRSRGMHITIETAGTLYLPLDCDLMSISPKLAGSGPKTAADSRWQRRHEQTRHAPDVVRKLVAEYLYQIKFVVGSRSDCDDAELWLKEFPEIDRARVLLMPEGTSQAELSAKDTWLPALCRERGVHYCPRKHIEWYGCVRGT